MKRQPDGTWRNARAPVVISSTTLRSRWLEAEVLHLKRMGLSFEAIAEQITRVGRGQAQALTPVPAELTFLPDYVVTKQACHKAFKRALARSPRPRSKSSASSTTRARRSYSSTFTPVFARATCARSKSASRFSITRPKLTAMPHPRNTS